MVVGTVTRLVVGLHVTGLGHAAAGGYGRPVFIDVMGNPLAVRLALSPVIAPCYFEGVDDFFTCIAGDTFFLEIMPLEHAVGRNPVVELHR